MRKSVVWAGLSLVLAVALVVPAGAQSQGAQGSSQGSAQMPVVDQREQNQKARIKQGVKSGELTKAETAKLAQEQKEIRQDEQAAKADGVVTKEERKDLHKELNQASRDIARQKHDAQVRPAATPGVNQRQANQRARINQGVKSGELTKAETLKLAGEQKEIRQDERQAKSDGVVTKQERKELHREQNQASRHIYKQKHDAQKRPKAQNRP